MGPSGQLAILSIENSDGLGSTMKPGFWKWYYRGKLNKAFLHIFTKINSRWSMYIWIFEKSSSSLIQTEFGKEKLVREEKNLLQILTDFGYLKFWLPIPDSSLIENRPAHWIVNGRPGWSHKQAPTYISTSFFEMLFCGLRHQSFWNGWWCFSNNPMCVCL